MTRTGHATQVLDTPQKSARVPANSVGYIVIHHAATESFEAVLKMEMGSKQVSSTVVIKDDRVASMMDETFRAWSLSSQRWDSISLSSETCNSGGAAQGWPISEASYLTLAKVVADWCARYSIPCNRDRILGHREVYTRHGASYATACPGGINLDRVVSMAAAILAPPARPTVIRNGVKMEIRVIRVGGPDAQPIVKFMAFGPDGKDVQMTPEEWGATSIPLGAASPTSAMHVTQRQYDLELALVRKTAATGVALTDADLAKIAAAIKPVDVAALVKAIDASDDDEHADLLAAIKASPEAFRALLSKAIATV